MRLIEVLKRRTRYLIFIRSNRVSFYKVQCAIFAKQFSILILYKHAIFPTFSRSGNAFTKFPTFSDRGNPVKFWLSLTLTCVISLQKMFVFCNMHLLCHFFHQLQKRWLKKPKILKVVLQFWPRLYFNTIGSHFTN